MSAAFHHHHLKLFDKKGRQGGREGGREQIRAKKIIRKKQSLGVVGILSYTAAPANRAAWANSSASSTEAAFWSFAISTFGCPLASFGRSWNSWEQYNKIINAGWKNLNEKLYLFYHQHHFFFFKEPVFRSFYFSLCGYHILLQSSSSNNTIEMNTAFCLVPQCLR